VLAARDGVEALDLFRVHQAEVGCLVCDLSMPRLGGWETLAEIRRLAPTLPAILSSGHDESAAMDGTHAEMPQAFLHKPYDTNALIGAITKAMETAVKA
jgi:CheY-like chemotaxis protein